MTSLYAQKEGESWNSRWEPKIKKKMSCCSIRGRKKQEDVAKVFKEIKGSVSESQKQKDVSLLLPWKPQKNSFPVSFLPKCEK